MICGYGCPRIRSSSPLFVCLINRGHTVESNKHDMGGKHMSRETEAFQRAIEAYNDVYEELEAYDSVLGGLKEEEDYAMARGAFDLLLQGILLNVAAVGDAPMAGPLAVAQHITSLGDIAAYMGERMNVELSWEEIDSMGHSRMSQFVDLVNDELDSIADAFLYLFAENFSHDSNIGFLKRMCDKIIDICIEAGKVSGGVNEDQADVIDERLETLVVDRFPILEKVVENSK